MLWLGNSVYVQMYHERKAYNTVYHFVLEILLVMAQILYDPSKEFERRLYFRTKVCSIKKFKSDWSRIASLMML